MARFLTEVACIRAFLVSVKFAPFWRVPTRRPTRYAVTGLCAFFTRLRVCFSSMSMINRRAFFEILTFRCSDGNTMIVPH